MGESFASPAALNNASNHVLPQPALPSSIVGEDDDEPPSSGGARERSAQVEPETGLNSIEFNVTVQNDLAAVISIDTQQPPLQEKDAAHFMRRKGVAQPEDVEKHLDVVGLPAARPRGRVLIARRPTTKERLLALFRPTRDLGPPPTYMASLMATIKYSPLNICLAFIPISWALSYTNQSATLVFVFSALGIIPLAALLGLGTEQIALRTSQSIGGLLNATLGNVVEMIIAGIALKHCELELVQSSLLGGLLSNLLLVLGMAFIVGGFKFHQQEFQPMVAQLNSSLMIVSVISLIVPAAFHEYLENKLPPGTEVQILLQLSRGTAIILIFIYIAYLFFQFYSHNHLFLDTTQSGSSSSSSRSSSSSYTRTSTDSLPMPVTATPSISSSSSSSSDDEPELPKLNTSSALVLLVACTAFAYVTAEHLIGSLEGLVAAHPNISKEWITLIVIPVISNAAEHTTAVVVASKGKFDLAMSVAVGSCIQIALFVIPVLVLVAWGMGKPLTLLFDPLETLVLFFSVLIVKFSVEDGKSHWMSGLVLIATYVIIALSFWNFPETVRILQGQPLLCT